MHYHNPPKEKLCIPIAGNRSWILGRLCSFACRLWAQPAFLLRGLLPCNFLGRPMDQHFRLSPPQRLDCRGNHGRTESYLPIEFALEAILGPTCRSAQYRQASAALLPWLCELCELSGLLLRHICFLLLPKPSNAFAGPKISKWSLLTFSLDKPAKEESAEWPAGWGWGWKAQAEWRWVRRLAASTL